MSMTTSSTSTASTTTSLMTTSSASTASSLLALLYPAWRQIEHRMRERSIKGCVGQSGMSSLSVTQAGSLCKREYLNRWRRMSQPSRNKLSNSVTLLRLGSSPGSSSSSLDLFSATLLAPLLTLGIRFQQFYDRSGVLHPPPEASWCHGAEHKDVHRGTHEGGPQRDPLIVAGDKGQLHQPGGLPQRAHLRAGDGGTTSRRACGCVGVRGGGFRQGLHHLEAEGQLLPHLHQA
jgi:hypothetical protein